MQEDIIPKLRQISRKLVRELGMLQLNKENIGQTPSHWHALIEISKEPGITISRLGQMLLLSVSSLSRIVARLVEEGLADYKYGIDRREKYLHITATGDAEIRKIDEFSNSKVKGAFAMLSEADQEDIINAITKYGDALEQSRLLREQVKILTLSTSRAVRKQIIAMIENIQKNEFFIPITSEINACVIKAEEEFYYNNSYNFWYAVDKDGSIIGSIGLKKIDDNYGEIKKFFVAKRYRGNGIAPKLMQVLMKAAIKHGFTNIVLGTVSKLHAAQKFYRKCGFAQIEKHELPAGFVICPLDTVFFNGKTAVVSSNIANIED